jgi:hypothetical protein
MYKFELTLEEVGAGYVEIQNKCPEDSNAANL